MSTNILPSLVPTFGVEVEFMIATLLEDDDKTDPHEDVEGLPPVLRVPSYYSAVRTQNEYILGRVKEVLDECFDALPPLSSAFSSELEVDILYGHLDWGSKEDSSIRLPSSDSYNFVGIEVTSPVQFASSKAFDTISFAISAITSKFRCMVNRSCGLHVHVGLGIERLPLEHIRRIASLSYAVEPLLFTLHDPVRRVNMYSKPIRDYSRLADGVIGQNLEKVMDHSEPAFGDLNSECYNYLGQNRRHGEEALSVRNQNVDKAHIEAFLETRQRGHFEPFTEPGDSRHTKLLPEISDHISTAQPASSLTITAPTELALARQRNIPRLRLPQFSSRELLSMRRRLVHFHAATPDHIIDRVQKRGPGPGVFEATQRIYSQPASCYISSLLSGETRPAISFESYSCTSLDPENHRRTIEYRFAEGSLEGEWVSTWAKIIVGLFKFALYSSPSKFIDVLENCDRATKEDGVYDVIDFLDDVGLFAEAEIAERRLTANKDRWNLTFVEPES